METRGSNKLQYPSNGHTRNIAEGPSSILGHVIGSTTLKSRAASAKKLESKLLSAIKRNDERPIRGEYKIWILKNYVASLIQFLLTVDPVSENSLLTIQKILKYIKSWLNLPRCLTQTAIYHPDVLHLPFLPHIKERAKLSTVSTLELSTDPPPQLENACVC